MSKIGIYSDVHISRTSSILPLYLNENDKYTYRLNKCKQAMTYAYDIFYKNNVDAIVNCGDTFNSHTITSDELSLFIDTIKEIYKPYDKGCPYLNVTLIGNHDKYNNIFNSMSMEKLNTYDTIVENYMYFNIDNCDCYCINYYEPEEFNKLIVEMLENYPKQYSKSILFMHGDINGSYLSGIKRIENRISREFLTNNFDIIFNGHIHCHEVIYNNKETNKKIINIGSLTTHSFADSNNHIGACYIFDTETNELDRYEIPNQTLFRTYEINSKEDIKALEDNLIIYQNSFNFIIKIKCNVDFKESIEKLLKSFNNVIKYKFILSYNKKTDNESKTTNNNVETSIEDEFISFLSSRNDLKGNLDDYIKNIESEN